MHTSSTFNVVLIYQ